LNEGDDGTLTRSSAAAELDGDDAVCILKPADLPRLAMEIGCDGSVTQRLAEIAAAIDLDDRQFSTLLCEFPKGTDGRVDLRQVQGSGFYRLMSHIYCYYKGAGSVEALALHQVFGKESIAYPSFGFEYPGEAGTFSSTSFLGVKLKEQALLEYAAGFVLTISYIEKNPHVQGRELLGLCPVPLAVVQLNRLTRTLRASLSDKSAFLQKKYSGATAAAFVGAAPSCLRGTDNHDVDGAWLETRNVYWRTLFVHPDARLHESSFNPYWSRKNARYRGGTIRFLLHAGFLHEPIGAHFQNVYYVKEKTTGAVGEDARVPPHYRFQDVDVSAPLVAADLCDIFPSSALPLQERITILSNVLCGWRIAESMGQRIIPRSTVPAERQIEAVASFLCGLMDDERVGALAPLVALLPYSSYAAIAEIMVSSCPPDDDMHQIWAQILALIDFDGRAAGFVERASDQQRIDAGRLAGAVRSNRAASLHALVKTWIRDPGEVPDLVLKGTRSLLTALCAHPNVSLAYHEFTIECLLRAGGLDSTRQAAAQLEQYLEDEPGGVEKHCVARLSGIVRLLEAEPDDDSLARKIEDLADEMIHATAWDVRGRIIACIESGNIAAIVNWLERFLGVIGFFSDAPGVEQADAYLGFLFKRGGLAAALLRHPATAIAIIHDKIGWDYRKRPVTRTYYASSVNTTCASVATRAQWAERLERLFQLTYLDAAFALEGSEPISETEDFPHCGVHEPPLDTRLEICQ
jgi:hypothetical protein